MRTGKYVTTFIAVFLMGLYFVQPASAVLFGKKDTKASQEKSEKPAEAASTSAAPSLTLLSPKTQAVSGPFHVAVGVEPDTGFDQLILRSMGNDVACEKNFNRGDKYELDCDTGKAVDGSNFILQAQAFSVAKKAVVASYSQVLNIGTVPAPQAASDVAAPQATGKPKQKKGSPAKSPKEEASKMSKGFAAKAPIESPKP